MKEFLFIDFGASRIKSIKYDLSRNTFSQQEEMASPFLFSDEITKKDLSMVLKEVIKKYTNVTDVITCTIIGGGYEDDIYYSWKSNKQTKSGTCLISELFCDQETYHVYCDHAGPIKKINFLGLLGGKAFYSSLGDTDCVRRSFPLKNNSCILNLGTGSQVIETKKLTKYIPSGRALNVYKKYFQSMGVDMFGVFGKTTLQDLENSTIEFDLNLFKQALNYKKTGASIQNIQEDNFTVSNFIYSLFRSYLDQYVPYIQRNKEIYLTGGISRKYPVIKEYFESKTGKEIFLRSEYIEDTFLGIKNQLLKDYENISHRC